MKKYSNYVTIKKTINYMVESRKEAEVKAKLAQEKKGKLKEIKKLAHSGVRSAIEKTTQTNWPLEVNGIDTADLIVKDKMEEMEKAEIKVQQLKMEIADLELAIGNHPEVSNNLDNILNEKRDLLRRAEANRDNLSFNAPSSTIAKIDADGKYRPRFDPEVQAQFASEWWYLYRRGKSISNEILSAETIEKFKEAIQKFDRSFARIPDSGPLKKQIIDELLENNKPEKFYEVKSGLTFINSSLAKMVGTELNNGLISLPYVDTFDIRKAKEKYIGDLEENSARRNGFFKDVKNDLTKAKAIQIPFYFGKDKAKELRESTVNHARCRIQNSAIFDQATKLLLSKPLTDDDLDYDKKIDAIIAALDGVIAIETKWSTMLAEAKRRLPEIKALFRDMYDSKHHIYYPKLAQYKIETLKTMQAST